ncbi:unnamed protein product [Victoria cruziana]
MPLGGPNLLSCRPTGSPKTLASSFRILPVLQSGVGTIATISMRLLLHDSSSEVPIRLVGCRGGCDQRKIQEIDPWRMDVELSTNLLCVGRSNDLFIRSTTSSRTTRDKPLSRKQRRARSSSSVATAMPVFLVAIATVVLVFDG